MHSKNSKNHGFTLIELLVVISIIGLLSSVVLANMASARDRAKIAAGLLFDSHNYSVFGANALGAWSLTEGVGTTAYNNLGRANGTITNGNWVNGLNGKKALRFNGISGDVDIPYSEDFPDYSKTLTISAWVNLDGAVGNWAPITFSEAGGRGWWFGFFPNSTNMIHWSNAGLSSNDLSCTIPDALNKWRQITGTYRSGVGRKLYVDGNLICSDSATGSIVRATGNIYIGGRSYGTINGTIQHVRIYADSP